MNENNNQMADTSEMLEDVKENTSEQEQQSELLETAEEYADVGDESTNQTQYERRESKALETCALIFGILSIVACCCYGIFGFVGVLLSVIALTRGKKSAKTIVGLILSILGLVLSIGLWMFSKSDDAKAIKQAYNEYNMQKDYNAQFEESEYDDLKAELEAAVDTSAGTNAISSEEAGKITIDGITYTIPGALSQLLETYEISETSVADAQKGLEPGKTTYIELAKDGVATDISVSVENNTDAIITDIKDASIYSLSVSNDAEYSISEVSVYNGISIGMTSTEVKEALEGIKYDENEMAGYLIYGVTAGDDEEYLIGIMFKDDVVVCLDIYLFV